MGIPSISIYAHELICDYHAKKLIRVGTCGGLKMMFMFVMSLSLKEQLLIVALLFALLVMDFIMLHLLILNY